MTQCEACGERLCSISEKGRRQHERSRVHKAAVRGEEGGRVRQRRGGAFDRERPQETFSCPLHDGRGWRSEDNEPDGEDRVVHHPMQPGWAWSSEFQSEDDVVCMSPPATSNPRKALRSGEPFVTWKALPSEEEEQEVRTWNISDVIERCCRGGGRRVPNLDIDGQNTCVESFSHALKLLRDAQREGTNFWTSMQADVEVIHPEWWPLGHLVPVYTNILMTQGTNSGIGLHVDVDHVGRQGDLIDTYVTLLQGSKKVVMLPPGSVPPGLAELSDFPGRLNQALLEELIARSGYYFALDATKRPLTLFIPKGWHHWLVSSSENTIAFTASKH